MASGVRLPDGKIHDHCEFDESANDSMNRQFRGSNTTACFCCSLVLFQNRLNVLNILF